MSESQPGQPSGSSPLNSIPAGDADVPFEISQDPVTPEGPHEPAADTIPAPAYEHLGELPATYGTQSVYLVAYDPRRLFVYWDVDWSSAPHARHGLRVCRVDGAVESEIEISAADAGRYVEIRLPGGTYYVEMGARGRDGTWQPKALSSRVTMPPEGLSGETEPRFATLPFHLSFQRLLELIQNAMGTGEGLTAALSRLQQGDQPQVTALLGHLGHLNGEQLHTLETLLGKHLDLEGGSSSSGGSEQHLLRDRHEAAAAGLSSGEHLASGGFGSEAIFSGGFGSEQLSSGAFGGEKFLPLSASGSETLSSGAFGGGSESLPSGLFGLASLSSETLASGGFGSEAFSSFPQGLGGGSDLFDNERAALFLRAMEHNLDVLGSLFSAFGSPGASDSFSSGGW